MVVILLGQIEAQYPCAHKNVLYTACSPNFSEPQLPILFQCYTVQWFGMYVSMSVHHVTYNSIQHTVTVHIPSKGLSSCEAVRGYASIV